MPSSPPSKDDYQTFPLGAFKLQSSATLPSAFLAYQTFGSPSSPAIIYPTWYSGLLSDNHWLIGAGHALDPDKYYIIVVALFGNSQSSSPSNTPALRPWPDVTVYDNVRAQKLLVDSLGVKHAFAVLGWSMGAAQTYQWGTQYPDFATLLAPFCGAARTSPHNAVFLEGVKAALLAPLQIPSAGIAARHATPTWTPAAREAGLKALARVYAGWGFSQAFYRAQTWRTELGFASLEGFMTGFWEAWALAKDPDDMLAMLWTWQAADVSRQEPYGGDFERAMAAIKARTLVMPGRTDLYFPPEDSEYEVQCMRDGVGVCVPFPSIWGHWAGGPGQSKEDVKWLDEKLKKFFAEAEKEEVQRSKGSEKVESTLDEGVQGLKV